MKKLLKWIKHVFLCLAFSVVLLSIIFMYFLIKEWVSIGHPPNFVYFSIFGLAFTVMCVALYPILRAGSNLYVDNIAEEFKHVKKMHYTNYFLTFLMVCSIALAVIGYSGTVAEYNGIEAELAMRDELNVSGVAVSISRALPRYVYDTLAYTSLRSFKNDNLTYEEAEEFVHKTNRMQLMLFGGLVLFGVCRYVTFRHECWVKLRRLANGGQSDENNSAKN